MYDKVLISTFIFMFCILVCFFLALHILITNSNEEKHFKRLIFSMLASCFIALFSYFFLPIPEYQPDIHFDDSLINPATFDFNVSHFQNSFNDISISNDQKRIKKRNLYLTDLHLYNNAFQSSINKYISISGNFDEDSKKIKKIFLFFSNSPYNPIGNILLVTTFTLQVLNPYLSNDTLTYLVNSIILPNNKNIDDFNYSTHSNNTITLGNTKFSSFINKYRTFVVIEPLNTISN